MVLGRFWLPLDVQRLWRRLFASVAALRFTEAHVCVLQLLSTVVEFSAEHLFLVQLRLQADRRLLQLLLCQRFREANRRSDRLLLQANP